MRRFEGFLTDLGDHDKPVKHGEHIWPARLRAYRLQVTLCDAVRERVQYGPESGNDLVLELLALSSELKAGDEASDEEFEDGLELSACRCQELFLVGRLVARVEEGDNVVRVLLLDGERSDFARVLLDAGECVRSRSTAGRSRLLSEHGRAPISRSSPFAVV